MKKVTAFMLSALVCVSLLPACARQGNDVHNTTMGDDSSAALADVQLTTFSLFAEETGDGAVYKALLQEFKAENPAVKITDRSKAYSEDVQADLTAAFESGSQPDVFFFHTGTNAAFFANEALVVPVDKIKEKYPDYARDIQPYALKNIADGGKALAVPVRGFYEGLFVNADLFEQYKLELPTSWALFKKAADTFAQAGIVPLAVSLGDTPHYLLDQLIFSIGGVQDYQTVPKAASEIPQSWSSAMQTITELQKQGAFGQPENDLTESEATDLFLQKKAAMKADGSWFAARLEADGLGDSTMVLPFPTVDGGKKAAGEITGGFSSGFYISRKAWDDIQKQAAVVALVKRLTGADAIGRLSNIGGLPAATVSASASQTKLAQSAYELCGTVKTAIKPLDARMDANTWSSVIASVPAAAKGELTAERVFAQAFDNTTEK